MQMIRKKKLICVQNTNTNNSLEINSSKPTRLETIQFETDLHITSGSGEIELQI